MKSWARNYLAFCHLVSIFWPKSRMRPDLQPDFSWLHTPTGGPPVRACGGENSGGKVGNTPRSEVWPTANAACASECEPAMTRFECGAVTRIGPPRLKKNSGIARAAVGTARGPA